MCPKLLGYLIFNPGAPRLTWLKKLKNSAQIKPFSESEILRRLKIYLLQPQQADACCPVLAEHRYNFFNTFSLRRGIRSLELERQLDDCGPFQAQTSPGKQTFEIDEVESVG